MFRILLIMIFASFLGHAQDIHSEINEDGQVTYFTKDNIFSVSPSILYNGDDVAEMGLGFEVFDIQRSYLLGRNKRFVLQAQTYAKGLYRTLTKLAGMTGDSPRVDDSKLEINLGYALKNADGKTLGILGSIGLKGSSRFAHKGPLDGGVKFFYVSAGAQGNISATYLFGSEVFGLGADVTFKDLERQIVTSIKGDLYVGDKSKIYVPSFISVSSQFNLTKDQNSHFSLLMGPEVGHYQHNTPTPLSLNPNFYTFFGLKFTVTSVQ